MLFSVVIPLYNNKKYIARSVCSVLKQRYKDFELIIVDDGSTDGGTGELKYIDDPRIFIFQQKNTGVAAARNKGGELAQGEWIAFLDADDQWLPDHLLELFRLIQECRECEIVATQLCEITIDGIEVPSKIANLNISGEVNYFKLAQREDRVVHSSTVAIKKEIFCETGGFSPLIIGEDQEMWVRICLKYRLAISSQTTVLYHRHIGSAMYQLGSFNHEKPIEPPAPYYIIEQIKIKKYGLICKLDLKNYVNHKLVIAFKENLYNGNVERAKKAANKIYTTPKLGYIFFYIMGRMPSFFILSTLIIVKKIRKFWKRCKYGRVH